MANSNGEESMSGSSPASTGPAGSRFEGQVGAHYLLTMLAGSEPRGLPGTSIDRIAFQRGDDGFPLDDVIIQATERLTGRATTLQIQVKRSVSFAPTDAVFKKVVGQIAAAIGKPEFWSGRHELAIATAAISRKISGPYQDVLRWARQLGTAALFFERLGRSRTGSNDMRAFVATLRDHLRAAGMVDDDELVWKVLGRLQILVFDYTAVGSASEALAIERCVRVLPSEASANASALWSTMVDLSEEIASDGGDRDLARLKTDLSKKSFRLAPDPGLSNVRTAIGEASSQALADISTSIAEMTIARSEWIEAVNAALDQGRYIEIRGDAGVGKSGILKHFAELLALEGHVIVLTPGRTPPRGWAAMRAMLSFSGTAKDLLSDLMFDGGAALFIDNLDSFTEDERKTANDLLRAAAEVPGLMTLVTARRNFGTAEQSWLDQKAIATLGKAEAVVVDELTPSEVAELSGAAPHLSELLSEHHPARDVVRNLYRLSRLAMQPKSTSAPTSELDMARQWWESADGPRNESHRDRGRVLRRLAQTALAGKLATDVGSDPATAIDDLIRSETLRDLGNDQVAFRHDVLRQWAIGCLLSTDAEAYTQLSMATPATAVLSRGVELAATADLAADSTGAAWAATLSRLSGESIHASWRRAALLALVHGANAAAWLDRETDRLLMSRAELLCELIRTVMAVDVEPASQVFAKFGLDATTMPANMFVPANASWHRLIIYVLRLGATLPASAVSTVADFYIRWMIGVLGQDTATPTILTWLHAWLIDLEGLDQTVHQYTGQFGRGDAADLAETLRTGFLAFCNKSPDLAVDYINRVRAMKNDHGVVKSIMAFRGTLAQAAPKELAVLTAEKLIAEPAEPSRYQSRHRDDVFEFLDLDFMPAGPHKGPFLELLTHSPQDGLDLIRKLVDHAVTCRTGGRDPGEDGFSIPMPTGTRFFPWTATYPLARGVSNDYALTSGLMALATWANQRVSNGEEFADVLAAVLGPPGTPAAYLLVAVDLIIAHWPKGQEAAISLLASPELLCMDRMRQAQDQFQSGSLIDATRLSKDYALENLVGNYACHFPTPLRTELHTLLEAAAQRLGPPDKASNFSDPAFMARHALYLLDPENWREVQLQQPNGTVINARNYEPPEVEALHLAPLSTQVAANTQKANISAALFLAIDDPSRSDTDLAAQAATWAHAELAQRPAPSTDASNPTDRDADFVDGEAARAAALITLRDGDDDVYRLHGSWAETTLLAALDTPEDSAHRRRSGLQFNPIATGFAGISELYRRDPTTERLRILLEVAARPNPAAVHGFSAVALKLAAINERLPVAILRCALNACVKPNLPWNASELEASKRKQEFAELAATRVTEELAWLAGQGPEPAWPDFEPEGTRVKRRRRRGIGLDGASAPIKPIEPPLARDIYIDDQAAALWVTALASISDVSKRPWLRDLVDTYADFSASLNGAGLGEDEEVSQIPDEWNAAFYPLSARVLLGLSSQDILARVSAMIARLPDQSFYDVTAEFLMAIDVMYFDDHRLDNDAPGIRQAFIDRLTSTIGWRRVVGQDSSSTEIHIAPAIATIFFNSYGLRSAKCYLPPKAFDRIAQFVPILSAVLKNGPSFFVAIVAMNLLEISPRATLLPALVAGGQAWVASYGNDTSFWVGTGTGRRLCLWIDEVRTTEPEAMAPATPERQAIDTILATLVTLGLAEARLLEATLSAE